MAKKNKRQTRKVSGGVAVREPVERQAAAPQEMTSTLSSSRVSSADFNPDYSETIKDLKRIGVLAGSFFFILVIISFFLR
jgi:hypothetical protein